MGENVKNPFNLAVREASKNFSPGYFLILSSFAIATVLEKNHFVRRVLEKQEDQTNLNHYQKLTNNLLLSQLEDIHDFEWKKYKNIFTEIISISENIVSELQAYQRRLKGRVSEDDLIYKAMSKKEHLKSIRLYQEFFEHIAEISTKMITYMDEVKEIFEEGSEINNATVAEILGDRDLRGSTMDFTAFAPLDYQSFSFLVAEFLSEYFEESDEELKGRVSLRLKYIRDYAKTRTQREKANAKTDKGQEQIIHNNLGTIADRLHNFSLELQKQNFQDKHMIEFIKASKAIFSGFIVPKEKKPKPQKKNTLGDNVVELRHFR